MRPSDEGEWSAPVRTSRANSGRLAFGDGRHGRAHHRPAPIGVESATVVTDQLGTVTLGRTRWPSSRVRHVKRAGAAEAPSPWSRTVLHSRSSARRSKPPPTTAPTLRHHRCPPTPPSAPVPTPPPFRLATVPTPVTAPPPLASVARRRRRRPRPHHGPSSVAAVWINCTTRHPRWSPIFNQRGTVGHGGRHRGLRVPESSTTSSSRSRPAGRSSISIPLDAALRGWRTVDDASHAMHDHRRGAGARRRARSTAWPDPRLHCGHAARLRRWRAAGHRRQRAGPSRRAHRDPRAGRGPRSGRGGGRGTRRRRPGRRRPRARSAGGRRVRSRRAALHDRHRLPGARSPRRRRRRAGAGAGGGGPRRRRTRRRRSRCRDCSRGRRTCRRSAHHGGGRL